MIPLPLLYGGITVAGLLACWGAYLRDRRYWPNAQASIVLALGFVLCVLLCSLEGNRRGMSHYAPIDVVLGLAILQLWQARPARWKRLLFATYPLELVFHVWFFWEPHRPTGALIAYQIAVNAVYVLQQTITTLGPAIHVGQDFCDWLLPTPYRHRRAGAFREGRD